MVTAQSTTQGSLTFGQRYAVLNLDFMTILIDAIKDTTEGQAFITNCSRWNNAVHMKNARPLTIFTTLYFAPGRPELATGAPFTKLLEGFGSFDAGSPEVQIASNFVLDAKDIVLQKIRWHAGSGNNLEHILKAQNIDTVIISGLTLSGAVMSTIYRLFDLDYQIYVISDNVLELPLSHHLDFSKVMLDALLPKMNLRSISVEEALEALGRS
ncbi:hypothetical protein HRR83_004087 [Exophiala dermatitidis]|uniref:Isochorismatase-like domain-containing protein n=2 Tax=Exophiala dermatitidis TaxID=5970 RepID=H6BRV7_EXODN|nr:uncharacterized protein HMPREF1120_02949 [Exophiala dermatitidis NIH/UT8656]KAJ4507509.1 hypothetical protein HRR73_007730 [Exophiala dermatitidis]EHY54785.1 hypothetical protein HMPREF1120_02949 [Exophiala dermatitidis NIH/UT8656]KAJ4517922.1 hypothetical protein HRR75_003143 [Exophiala dermatitidis]KAJ4521608.1 hypothetical protein HRR74_003433 [Exophiala dermatitidis]KAJ4533308.1 hypothetical protein HRR77_008658 [Exophiala dermatitidis]